MRPWASATLSTVACDWTSGLVMMVAPPTNTSANVPTNSATKCRQVSLICRSELRVREESRRRGLGAAAL